MRGHVRKRGTWQYILELGDQPTKRCTICNKRHWVGRRPIRVCVKCGGSLVDRIERKQQVKTGFKTKKEAEGALADALTALRQQTYVEPTKLTVREFLEGEWLPAIETTIRPATYASYSTHVRVHIVPNIGTVMLQSLTAGHLNRLYADLARDGKRRGDGKLSASSVRRVHATLHRALRDACRWGYLVRNPAENADPPRASDPTLSANRAWQAEDLKTFLEAVKEDRLYPLWLTLGLTGLRRGEALGLLWQDVDLKAGRLVVRRSRVPVNAKVVVSEPKTKRGHRSVTLDSLTVAALKTWHKRQLEERVEWRGAWNDTGLVFTREDGTGWRPERISQMFARLVKKAKVPAITVHGLRHTHATLALMAGINPRVVADRLGHSTVALTLDVYSHAIPSMEEEAAARIAALVTG
ncbi:MAG: site-specific integrase [Thermoleophilia bacterium]|nr:site-specific integrase [Thermoleophilia bacterium]